MHIQPVSKARTVLHQPSFSKRLSDSYRSSLQELTKKKNPSVCTIFFHALFKSFQAILCKEEKKQMHYIKIKGNGQFKYRLIDKRRKEQAVKLGHKIVYLEDLSIPKGKQSSKKMKEMILKIMEEEKIDGIQTTNWAIAFILHRCGLKTKSLILFNLGHHNGLNQQIQMIFKEAIKQKNLLSDTGIRCLARLEEAMLRSIVAETLTYEGDNSSKQLHQSVSYSKDDVMMKYFQANLAKSKIRKWEKILDYSVDLQTMKERISRKNKEDEYFYKALEMIEDAKEDQKNSSIEPIELPITELFLLMDLLKIKPSKTAIKKLPNIDFSK